MIDRYLLRYFLAVVDTGSFSKGAAQVNVTQPTLSVGIAKLERLLATPLFHRSSQRIHLTEAGSRLLPHARRIEAEFAQAVRSVAASDTSPVVRVGVLSTIPTAQLERLVAEHRGRGEDVPIEIVEGAERDLVSRLARGRIDLAITVLRPGADRRQEPLYREGYALALPRWHRLAGADMIEAEDLAEETMIVRRHCEVLPETSRYFTERGVRPRFSFRTMNDDKALALVRAGLGITVMPESYRDAGVARPRLVGFDLVREIGLIHGDDGLDAAAVEPVVDSIRATLAGR